jgi:uncharacterized membrane protein YebE (DUF533 family)
LSLLPICIKNLKSKILTNIKTNKMNKKTKMYVGVAVVALAAYYFYHQAQMKKAAAAAAAAAPKASMTGGVMGQVTRP